MSASIDTTKVQGRRQLHFDSLADIAADVERLAQAKEVRALGNWSSGQVVQHLANTMTNSIDGFSGFVPFPLRIFLRLFMKGRFLNRTMDPGFNLPASAGNLLPPPTDWADAVAAFRAATKRLQTETKRSPHPALGNLSAEEWVRMHCRHSELHLSFLVPVE